MTAMQGNALQPQLRTVGHFRTFHWAQFRRRQSSMSRGRAMAGRDLPRRGVTVEPRVLDRWYRVRLSRPTVLRVPEALRCTSRRNRMSTDPTIIYTLTDEAPLLATCGFLPVIRTFTKPAGVRVEKSDISVPARILGNFPEYLRPEQRVPDTL